MNKFLLSLLIIVSSLFFIESQAIPSLWRGCLGTDSNKCKDQERFKKSLKKGCAGASSNCRLKFCKANCIKKLRVLGEDDWDALEAHDLRRACKNCLDNALLIRLDENSRKALYANFLPSEGRTGKRARKNARFAYDKEAAVQATQSQLWWRLNHKLKNVTVYKKLKAAYQKLLAEKTKKLEAAKARGNRRSVAQKKEEIAQLVAEAIETLVPSPMMPEMIAESLLVKKEFAKIAEERAEVAQSLVAAAGAPSEIADEAIEMAVEQHTDSDGNRYSIPTPPPTPGQSMAAKEDPAIAKISEELEDEGMFLSGPKSILLKPGAKSRKPQRVTFGDNPEEAIIGYHLPSAREQRATNLEQVEEYYHKHVASVTQRNKKNILDLPDTVRELTVTSTLYDDSTEHQDNEQLEQLIQKLPSLTQLESLVIDLDHNTPELALKFIREGLGAIIDHLVILDLHIQMDDACDKALAETLPRMKHAYTSKNISSITIYGFGLNNKALLEHSNPHVKMEDRNSREEGKRYN